MSQQAYFELYVETVMEGIKAIRKISFKKINQLNDLITKFQTFLTKEVYGRIKPSNYLLLFLIALGGKNSKLYAPLITVIQKLFSNNFINSDEQLSGSLSFLKDQHKQFLLLPYAQYSKKTFQQVYIETLVALPDKTQPINLLICKNMSLIFRLSQNNLPASLIPIICDFLVDTILINKTDQYDKILKSTFLQIVRHAIQSLKQASDRKLLEDDEQISIRQVCQRYGTILADEVAIKLNIENKYQISNYQIIPGKNPNLGLKDFKILQFEEVNEIGQKNGKFGWCAVCRKAANFYCRNEKIPVCGYQCKQINYFQTQQLEKFYYEEVKSVAIFTAHVQQFCKVFCKYLYHTDIRKKTCFAEIFIHLSSELRKISVKTVMPVLVDCLQQIFHHCCANMMLETQAFVACAVAVKKLIPLDIFNPQLEILLHQLGTKLTYFITPTSVKEQTLKFIRDLIKSQVFFQIFMNLDCKQHHRDVGHEIVQAISKLYAGITPPQGVTNLPPEQPNIRKLCYDILLLLQKSIRTTNKTLSEAECQKIQKMKTQKNKFKNAVKRFNQSEKPTKVIKKLISQKFLPNDPIVIADWVHKHIKKLSFVNIGQLIGDHDPLGISIRDKFIHQIKFKDHSIDESIRILLAHFTIPGQSQIVDRIIDSFSKEYFYQNKDEEVFLNSDAVFSFSYLLMMLQTNLHNPQVIQKMTLAQFNNLSKNMNGPGSEFPADFLEKVYSSIEKKQLGFHSKLKQIQVINAYQKGELKKAQQIHFKHIEKNLKKQYSHLRPQAFYDKKYDKYDVKLLTSELYGQIIEAISIKIRQTQQKQQLVKSVDLIEQMLKFSLSQGIQQFVAHAIKNIWEELSKTMTIKKYLLIQKMYIWVREFTAYVYQQWDTIIHSFSMFYKTKAIKKDNSNKNNIMVIIQDKCYLYDNYIETILTKSNKFNFTNLLNLIDALIQCSKQQIIDGQHTFCLQKIGDVFEYNNSRLNDIVPLTWPKLKEYYIQLGKHKVQKVALFGTDFLKQLITKFIKKKDLQFFQKQYMKPFQQVFNSNVSLGVKQYIVGGLSYFVNNYFPNIKDGWKIILSILCDSFEEDEDQIVKQKSYLIVKKIYETNFSIIDLDENYVDFVQILGRMARQKDQVYIKSCLQAIKAIISFYQTKLQINIENQQAEQNQKLDLIFWQTMWLPLLSTIYGICGDFRAEVQNQSIQLLFHILMRYGKLFKYEFWKMIMQGILRPTFEQITYTSQSKPLRKKQLQQWLKNSFSRLFGAINELIKQYFNDFKLFLPDILKIYESCIISNSNKILTQLSTEALTQLLNSVGDQFEHLNWKDYVQFVRTVLKKCNPYEIQSLQAWTKSQQNPSESAYQGKILTLNLILINCQTTVQKFSNKLKEQTLNDFKQIIDESYHFCHKFNKNIELRSSLWKNGFFEDMKSLPGLIKQQHQALKGKTLTAFKLIDKSEIYIDQYVQHTLKILDSYKKSLILSPPTQYKVELEEKQREGTMLQILILENIMPNLQTIQLPKIIQLGYKKPLFKHILEICTQRSYCSKCNFCEFCKTNGERQIKMTELMKKWLMRLFQVENQPQQTDV